MQHDNPHPFLALRSAPKGLAIDTGGYWSYPALVVQDKSLQWISLILPSAPMPEKKRSALFRPKAMIVLKANTPTLIRYENFRLGNDPFSETDWDKPIGMFPHKDLFGITYKQLEEAENQLLFSYEDAGELFLAKGTLPGVFVEAYLRLLHPAFLPFLKVVAPSFVSALTPKIVKITASDKTDLG
jgi:hypothetical protein